MIEMDVTVINQMIDSDNDGKITPSELVSIVEEGLHPLLYRIRPRPLYWVRQSRSCVCGRSPSGARK